jgi:hypothetical protein
MFEVDPRLIAPEEEMPASVTASKVKVRPEVLFVTGV